MASALWEGREAGLSGSWAGRGRRHEGSGIPKVTQQGHMAWESVYTSAHSSDHEHATCTRYALPRHPLQCHPQHAGGQGKMQPPAFGEGVKVGLGSWGRATCMLFGNVAPTELFLFQLTWHVLCI